MVATATRTVGKRVVRILLECFLICVKSLVVFLYRHVESKLYRYDHGDIFAIPFIAGRKVIVALRKFSQVKKVVYISCKPLGRAMYNFIE